MLRLQWSAEALDDLAAVIGFIAARNVAAAERMYDLVTHVAERLPTHPYLHRPGRVPGTREAVIHPNYILVYAVGAELLTILALLHARQRYP